MFGHLVLLWLPGLPAVAPRAEVGFQGAPRARQAPAPRPPAELFFVSKLAPEEIQNKQAVLETSMGTVVLDLLPDAAPNHVPHFIPPAREGTSHGTIFP